MALVLNDRVKETTTTTGTGTVNLAGAEVGFESFVAGIGNTNTTYYAIVHQSAAEFEVGLGTVSDSSPDTLSRTTILSSSNSDSAVNFSSGTKDVFCTLPASKAVFLNSSADINLADNSKILLGAGDDLRIYHDGSNSIIVDEGTGGLFLRGTNTVDIQSALGHNYLKSTISAGTQIYYDNSEKFATVSGGIKVTGNIENASGDLTIDVVGGIILDADDNGTVSYKDAGTRYGYIEKSSNDMVIQSTISDGDIKFNGNDDGSTITALTLDMSDAGTAIFNHDVRVGDNSFFICGAGDDVAIASDGTNGTLSTGNGDFTVDSADDIIFDADGGTIFFKDGGTEMAQINLDNSGYFDIYSSVQDADFRIRGNDGGSTVTALTIDMSAAGAATFNDNVTAYSDERLKDNIETIENGLDKVEQLRGVTYTRDEKESIGVIAQEVEKILPEIVLTADDEMGTKSVDYSRLTAVLIEAVKDLSARVKELEDK